MAFHVLVVCSANVCRSPSALVIIQRLLAGTPLADQCDLNSAGIAVVADSPWCPDARRWLIDTECESQVVLRTSRPLRTEVVRAADLVLVVGKLHRTRVIELVPSASSYAFTMSQAAVLGTAVRQSLPDWSARRRHDLLELAPVPVDGSASDLAR